MPSRRGGWPTVGIQSLMREVLLHGKPGLTCHLGKHLRVGPERLGGAKVRLFLFAGHDTTAHAKKAPEPSFPEEPPEHCGIAGEFPKACRFAEPGKFADPDPGSFP